MVRLVLLMCLRAHDLPKSLEQFGLALFANAYTSILDGHHQVHGIPGAPFRCHCGIKVESLFLFTEVDDIWGVRRRSLDGCTHGYSDVSVAILLGSKLDSVGYQVDQY